MRWTFGGQATREEFAYNKGVSRLERTYQARPQAYHSPGAACTVHRSLSCHEQAPTTFYHLGSARYAILCNRSRPRLSTLSLQLLDVFLL